MTHAPDLDHKVLFFLIDFQNSNALIVSQFQWPSQLKGQIA